MHVNSIPSDAKMTVKMTRALVGEPESAFAVQFPKSDITVSCSQREHYIPNKENGDLVCVRSAPTHVRHSQIMDPWCHAAGQKPDMAERPPSVQDAKRIREEKLVEMNNQLKIQRAQELVEFREREIEKKSTTEIDEKYITEMEMCVKTIESGKDYCNHNSVLMLVRKALVQRDADFSPEHSIRIEALYAAVQDLFEKNMFEFMANTKNGYESVMNNFYMADLGSFLVYYNMYKNN